MNKGLLIGLSVIAVLALTACGSSTAEKVDAATNAAVIQVGAITDNNATVNVKASDADGLVSATLEVNGQIIDIIIPAGAKSVDINKTLTNLPEDSDLEAILETTGVDGVDGEVADPVKASTTIHINETPNTAPVAIDGSVDGGGASSLTFSMADVILDAEDSDNELTIIVTQGPGYTDGSSSGTLSLNGVNATFEMSSGNGGDSYFLFKVIDKEGLESEEKQFILSNFLNL